MTHHLETQFFAPIFGAYLTNKEKAWLLPSEKPQRLIVRQITITNYNRAPGTINFHFSILFAWQSKMREQKDRMILITCLE